MSEQAIINARIVTPDEIFRGCVIYDDHSGKIKAVQKNLPSDFPKEQVTDAEDSWLVPGGIDAHVHLGGFGEIKIEDDFYTGSLGALAGGTTTVIDFCESEKGESPAHCIEKRMKEASVSAVDYAFHFVITRDYERQLQELQTILDYGITDFKLFTVYDNTDLTMSEIEHVIRELCRKIPDKKKMTFLVHAEEKEIIENLKKDVKNPSEMSMLAFTRPDISEQKAAEQLQKIAQKTGVNLCIAHTSAGATVALQPEQRQAYEHTEGFLLETCPHYLEFTDEKLKGEQGALYTMTPPLRKQKDTDLLWEGILNGKIDIFSTDHCPYSKKDKYGKNYDTVPCGVDGIQTRMLYLFSEGVKKRGLSMKRFVELTSENAARFYHRYPQKGCIQPGSDADLVLITEKENTKIHVENRKSNLDYTIYEGKQLEGKIQIVIKSGQTVYKNGKLNAEKGSGKYLV